MIFTVQWREFLTIDCFMCCYHLFQPLTMSQIPPGTTVVQPNGVTSQQPPQSQEPVVSFSPEGVDPSVSVVPPANVVQADQSSVIT